jgi:hypothetical protein
MGIGDWGLGQSPIPNPQSPIPNPQYSSLIFKIIVIKKLQNNKILILKIVKNFKSNFI